MSASDFGTPKASPRPSPLRRQVSAASIVSAGGGEAVSEASFVSAEQRGGEPSASEAGSCATEMLPPALPPRKTATSRKWKIVLEPGLLQGFLGGETGVSDSVPEVARPPPVPPLRRLGRVQLTDLLLGSETLEVKISQARYAARKFNEAKHDDRCAWLQHELIAKYTAANDVRRIAERAIADWSMDAEEPLVKAGYLMCLHDSTLLFYSLSYLSFTASILLLSLCQCHYSHHSAHPAYMHFPVATEAKAANVHASLAVLSPDILETNADVFDAMEQATKGDVADEEDLDLDTEDAETEEQETAAEEAAEVSDLLPEPVAVAAETVARADSAVAAASPLSKRPRTPRSIPEAATAAVVVEVAEKALSVASSAEQPAKRPRGRPASAKSQKERHAKSQAEYRAKKHQEPGPKKDIFRVPGRKDVDEHKYLASTEAAVHLEKRDDCRLTREMPDVVVYSVDWQTLRQKPLLLELFTGRELETETLHAFAGRDDGTVFYAAVGATLSRSYETMLRSVASPYVVLARTALLVTPSTFHAAEEDWIVELCDDEMFEGLHCVTDGQSECGTHVARDLGLIPSASSVTIHSADVQFRGVLRCTTLGTDARTGCIAKGLLIVNPMLPKKTLRVRASCAKVTWDWDADRDGDLKLGVDLLSVEADRAPGGKMAGLTAQLLAALRLRCACVAAKLDREEILQDLENWMVSLEETTRVQGLRRCYGLDANLAALEIRVPAYEAAEHRAL